MGLVAAVTSVLYLLVIDHFSAYYISSKEHFYFFYSLYASSWINLIKRTLRVFSGCYTEYMKLNYSSLTIYPIQYASICFLHFPLIDISNFRSNISKVTTLLFNTYCPVTKFDIRVLVLEYIWARICKYDVDVTVISSLHANCTLLVLLIYEYTSRFKKQVRKVDFNILGWIPDFQELLPLFSLFWLLEEDRWPINHQHYYIYYLAIWRRETLYLYLLRFRSKHRGSLWREK